MNREPTIIIAEAGINHNGSINIAKEMIDVASKAGADFVKFQTFKSENLVTKKAKLAEYQKKNRIYKDIDKNIFRTFDFANFLRGHDKFSESIKLYSDILSTMKSDNVMYPRILDRRGTS